MKEGTVVLALCALLMGAYSLGSWIYFKTGGIELSDTARFGWDTWEYQSMAANFAAGHGLKFGAIEDFSFYRFTQTGDWVLGDAGLKGYEKFLDIGQKGGSYNFYRTPGYPVFLGVLYKIFGISPKVARASQVFLVILVAAFLPYIGFAYWRGGGFAAGVISGSILMSTYVYIHNMQDELLTEPLIMFCAFLTVVMFIEWEKRKSASAAAALGIVMGAGILVKGSLVFTPLVAGLYFIYLIRRRLLRPAQFLAFALGVSFIVLSWSVYASVKEGRPIFISTQGQQVLLDSNSVISKDGRWHANASDVFYENPEIKRLPGPLKVIRFYQKHRELLPSIFINKLNVGFGGFFFFKTAMLFLLYSMAVNTLRFFDDEGKIKAVTYIKKILSVLMAIYLVWTVFVVCVVLFKVKLQQFAALAFANAINLMPGATILIYIFVVYCLVVYIFIKRCYVEVPVPFVILFLNFFLITLIFCGDPRFVKVIDFIFILTAIQAVISTATGFYGAARQGRRLEQS
ncbi:MAG: glycosyltransferase family 39 protein [Candidatus Magnetominusculus sp. LBB02]|nr:glycosyltransferase family 39 protein [Candidatus Magnetominusculus sp. LBB02]